MAITMTDKDGSYQEYDTYSEFEQAMVLMSRIGGNKVPQDLLDEVKAKYGDKETNPIQMEIDGTKVAEAIRKATEEFSEGFVEISKVRTPISDECGIPEKESKFEVGDKVKVVNNLSEGHPEGTVGVIDSVSYYSDEDNHSYGVDPERGSPHNFTLYHDEVELEYSEDSPTEFEDGDLVRVTESFGDSYGDVAGINSILPVRIDGTGRVLGVGSVLIGDNVDKLRLVCRKEDRKDIEL